MTTTKWDERAMDTALAEALDTDAPRSLVGAVLGASDAERRAAVERVQRAESDPRRWRVFSVAALITLAAAIVFGVWFSESNDGETSARWQDRVIDPKRVTPKTVDELEKLLGQVTGISLRQCTMQLPLKPTPVVLDLDIDMGALHAIDDATLRKQIVAAIEQAARQPSRRVRKNLLPGVRLVLHLRDGRNLHALIELGRTLRILDGRDFPLRDAGFAKLLVDQCANSNYKSLAHIGVATVPSLLTQIQDGKPVFSTDRRTLRVLQCQSWEDMAHLDGFTKLRQLTVSHSTGLDSRTFQRFGWPAKTRAVFAGLRLFSCPSVRAGDEDLARLIGFMPNLTELDLSTCPTIGSNTIRAMTELRSLRRIDLRRTKAFVNDVAILVGLPRDARVLLTRDDFSPKDRRVLEIALEGRIVWSDR